MSKDDLLISVITVCRNAQKCIAETIQSVLSQQNIKFEYCIIDGLSSDNTVSIAKQCIGLCDNSEVTVCLNSEKDEGIFDAMNKGVKLCKGRWVLFLNAGDALFDCFVLDRISKELHEADFVYGNTVYYNDKYYMPRYADNVQSIAGEKAGDMPFCHQACFMKKEILLLEPFRNKYKVCGDYDYFLNAYCKGRSFKKVDTFITFFEMSGLSNSRNNDGALDKWLICDEYGVLDKKRVNSLVKLEKLKRIIRCLIPYRVWQWQYVYRRLSTRKGGFLRGTMRLSEISEEIARRY